MEARKQDKGTTIESTFFLLPKQNLASGETNEAYAKRLSENIRIQINLTQDNEVATAEDLVQLCKKLPRPLALHILFDTTKNSPFKIADARDIIIRGIDEEDMARSPLNNGDKTCAFIKRYQVDHAEEVDYFLRNPDRLLFWLENAPALEISRLFSHYFKTGKEELTSQKEYSNHIMKMAENEIAQGKAGKATLCYSLMHRGPINEKGQPQLLAAIEAIATSEPNKLERMLQSARVKLNPGLKEITNASGCFITTHRLNLPNTNFNKLQLDGARMTAAALHHSTFVDASLKGAELQQSTLTESDFTNAQAQGINLYHAQLVNSTFIQADLRGANLAGANLTGANLYGAALNKTIFEGANLNDVTFFSRSLFKFPDAVHAELVRLETMLKGHAYYSILHEAILNDLLTHMQSPTIAEATIIRTLEAAYHHPLFSQHQEYATLKTITNTAVSVLPSSIVGFFWQPKDAAQLAKPYETKAQQAIREVLAQHKNCVVMASDMRPLPPRTAPATPNH